jgi:ATP-dependent DNA helicase RecG
MDLQDPVQSVTGIGPRRAAALARSGVLTVEDLLLHIPFRYEDRRSVARVADLRPGDRACVAGTITAGGLHRGRRISVYEARVADESGSLKAIWFGQPYLRSVLLSGRSVVLYGVVEQDVAGGRALLMRSPQFEVCGAEDAPGVHTGRIVPVYEALEGLTGKTLRRILAQLAGTLPDAAPDLLPSEVRDRLGLVGRLEALRQVHLPEAESDVVALNGSRSAAHVRLILEELFLFQLGLAWRRSGRLGQRKDRAFETGERVRDAVRRVIPFRLTGAQRRALREIVDDMRSRHPMHRLLQGDVGSGKTVVALLAAVFAMESGYQAAFMAPTEILADQHFLTFRRLLGSSYPVGLLTAAGRGAERAAVLAGVADGRTRMVVGTQALIQESIRFRRLGLVVIDEQHRFGVLQRDDLIRKGYDVDVLVMTATPIPRTLALTAYGDLDVSLIDEKPPGRKAVTTRHCLSSQAAEVRAIVMREVAAGHQAYVVYPLVEESAKLEEVRAATEMRSLWSAALPAVRVGLLHGRMRHAEKESVMSAFSGGQLQVLVSTSVVEVGVDVANATVMVVEHAERFGLAQLHQLRGRVGRGPAPSSCVLVSHGRLTDEARARLEAMVATDDGFVIAERDLEIRGAGDFFGTRQWGMSGFRVARLVRDRELLSMARTEAFRCADDVARGEADPALQAFLAAGGWERRFGLARVG